MTAWIVKELLDDLERWRAAGKRVALARVVDIEGSGPRDPGRGHGRQRGRRGGRLGVGRLRRGRGRDRGARHPRRRRPPARVRSATATTTRSPSASPAAARSTCSSSRSTGAGPIFDRAARRAAGRARRWRWRPWSTGPDAGRKLARAARRASRSGSLGDADLDRVVGARRAGRARRRARPACATTASTARPARTSVSVFIESFAPPPRMLIFGAVDFTAALVRVAKVLGYRVTVCDAREVFATTAAVPAGRRGRRRLARTACSSAVGADARPARRRVRAHPRPQVRRAGHRGRAAHHGRLPRRDGQSRRTHAERVERLREEGVDRRRARPGHGAHRPRPRRPHAGGDRRRRSAPRSSPCAPGGAALAPRRRRPDPRA